MPPADAATPDFSPFSLATFSRRLPSIARFRRFFFIFSPLLFSRCHFFSPLLIHFSLPFHFLSPLHFADYAAISPPLLAIALFRQRRRCAPALLLPRRCYDYADGFASSPAPLLLAPRRCRCWLFHADYAMPPMLMPLFCSPLSPYFDVYRYYFDMMPFHYYAMIRFSFFSLMAPRRQPISLRFS